MVSTLKSFLFGAAFTAFGLLLFGATAINPLQGLQTGANLVSRFTPGQGWFVDAQTATMLTRSTDVQSIDHWCNLSGGATSSFVCATPAPAAWCGGISNQPSGYAAGEWIDMVANVSTSGTASLNVNNCGVENVKLADGVTDPGAYIVKGSLYHFVNNGAVFVVK